MIYVGIDDTDIVGSPGTNQLARAIVWRLGPVAADAIICRHQLFFDPRVPYTNQNGSASIQLPQGDTVHRQELIAIIRDVMRGWFIDGSDPGLAVASGASPEMTAFAARAKTDVVTRQEARQAALSRECHLEGLGGTHQGIIGALAAIALIADGNDGRVVHVDSWPWPDAFCGVQTVEGIRSRGVTDIRRRDGETFSGDRIGVGKHLRPNWRAGRMMLFVDPPDDGSAVWRAAKLK